MEVFFGDLLLLSLSSRLHFSITKVPKVSRSCLLPHWKPALFAAGLGGKEYWIVVGAWGWTHRYPKFCPFLQLLDRLRRPKTFGTQIRPGKRELTEASALWEIGLWSKNGVGTQWTVWSKESSPALGCWLGPLLSLKTGPGAACLEQCAERQSTIVPMVGEDTHPWKCQFLGWW